MEIIINGDLTIPFKGSSQEFYDAHFSRLKSKADSLQMEIDDYVSTQISSESETERFEGFIGAICFTIDDGDLSWGNDFKEKYLFISSFSQDVIEHHKDEVCPLQINNGVVFGIEFSDLNDIFVNAISMITNTEHLDLLSELEKLIGTQESVSALGDKSFQLLLQLFGAVLMTPQLSVELHRQLQAKEVKLNISVNTELKAERISFLSETLPIDDSYQLPTIH